MIADGTGIGHYTLSYYSNKLFTYRDFDYIGLVATHPDDCSKGGCDTGFKKVTDSASSATAYSTGRKTFNGAIGVSKDNQHLETVVEIAEKYKMNTGCQIRDFSCRAESSLFKPYRCVWNVKKCIFKKFSDF